MVMSRWGCAVGGGGAGAAAAAAAAVARERLPALWRCIEDAHYSYLETDDSPEKLQQRKKLEGYIMEYLSLVPHSCKFGLAETGKVFQRTVDELAEFSAYRAGLGWAALARYAGNLLAQPWRKEYRTVRLYSGYYKHEVEANIVGSETLLQAMGYRIAGAGCVSLDGPACPDMVAAISRDAIIAHVECQVMAQIWEAVWGCGARVTWSEVAAERSRRTGDAAAAAARLAARHANADAHYIDGPDIYSNLSVSTEPQKLSEQSRMATCNHVLSPEESPLEEPIIPLVHPSYIVPSPHVLPPNMMYPMSHNYPEVPVTINPCNVPMIGAYGPVPYYYTPVQPPYMMPTPVYAPIKHATAVAVNGYPTLPQYRYPTVPTAQLIELDTTPTVYENGARTHKEDADRKKNLRLQEAARRNSTSRYAVSDVSLASIPRSDTQPVLSKSREDGMGTYESWDYVFRNLSSKHEDVRNRVSPSLDRDSRTLDRLDRDERRSRFQPTTLDLEDGLQAMTIDRSYDEEVYRTAKVNENLLKIKHENDQKRAKQLAKKQAAEDRKSRKVEPVANPQSDGLIVNKTPPDKVRLLTKKDVKDKKEIVKQQNGTMPVIHSDMRKTKKLIKAVSDVEKVKTKPLENGVHQSKNPTAGSSANHTNHYDLKTHLVVSLDETDSVRKSPPRQLSSNADTVAANGRHAREKSKDSTHRDVKVTGPSDKWECSYCTYLNSGPLSACEMCGKSRHVGPECLPLTSGGRECPACTLVNRRDAGRCEACNASLDHCPTYI